VQNCEGRKFITRRPKEKGSDVRPGHKGQKKNEPGRACKKKIGNKKLPVEAAR